jgi:hypothetical protein
MSISIFSWQENFLENVIKEASIDVVGTRKTKQKGKLLTVRVPEDALREFGIVAEIRDVSMSEMVFNFIRQEISVEKLQNPQRFSEEAVPPSPIIPAQSIVEHNSFLMFDPGGANAGTKRVPAKIRKDIADAKAHVQKKIGR